MDHGGRQYVAAVRRYDDEIGSLERAAPRDLTCEVAVLQRTGLSVREHQRRTVDNFVELQMHWDDDNTSPFMPVIQGDSPGSHLRCCRGRNVVVRPRPMVAVIDTGFPRACVSLHDTPPKVGILRTLAQGDGARQADSRAMSSPSIGSTSLMMRSALSAARSGSSVTPSAMPSV
jgi:hypothetical protein